MMSSDCYGFAKCPVCSKNSVDLSKNHASYVFTLKEKPTFMEIWFFFCDSCEVRIRELSLEKGDKHKILMREVWEKHIALGNDGLDYALSTNIVLIAYNWNVADAHFYGLDISRELNDAVLYGSLNPQDIAEYLITLGLMMKSNGLPVAVHFDSHEQMPVTEKNGP